MIEVHVGVRVASHIEASLAIMRANEECPSDPRN